MSFLWFFHRYPMPQGPRILRGFFVHPSMILQKNRTSLRIAAATPFAC